MKSVSSTSGSDSPSMTTCHAPSVADPSQPSTRVPSNTPALDMEAMSAHCAATARQRDPFRRSGDTPTGKHRDDRQRQRDDDHEVQLHHRGHLPTNISAHRITTTPSVMKAA